ncbi:pentapeptide repeat-containing protein [Campylobacter taeniopygiae]|uniref:pentapeptide repeat-containing protein n=1 Tax=Campylobacter taeniopygiae TaxID=2510188 RepID=UPI003D6ACD24
MEYNEQIIEIAKKLNIEKNKILYVKYSNLFEISDCKISIATDIFQKYNLFFNNCKVPKLVLDFPIQSLEFKSCCFEDGFIIRDDFNGYVSIENSIFENYFSILWVKKEIYKININKNNFNDVSIFENKILNFKFEENTIQNISVSNNLFSKEAYFNYNSFSNECIFFKNSFENLSFYEAKFNSFVFFQNTIKGSLNSVNANLNFDFENLENKINEQYEEFNKYKKEKDKKSLDKLANDFRDSFRIFKNALIKDNNLLDASNFHKCELYCKEIELKQSWDKKGKNVENMTDLEKNISRIRDFVDFLLLGFYRKLCDHHTDFLRVFNNLILLIALYVLFIFIGGFEFNLEKKSKDLDKLSNIFSFFTEAKQKILNFSFIQQYYGYILIIFCIICLIFIIVTLCKILKDIELGFIKNIIFKDGLKSLWNLCAYVFALLVVLLYINIFIPKSQNNLTILSNIGIFFTFCIFYLWIVYLNSFFLDIFL